MSHVTAAIKGFEKISCKTICLKLLYQNVIALICKKKLIHVYLLLQAHLKQ